MFRARSCVGISNLKVYRAEQLRALDEPLIVFAHSEPLAALVPYALYLRWQQVLTSCAVRLEPTDEARIAAVALLEQLPGREP